MPGEKNRFQPAVGQVNGGPAFPFVVKFDVGSYDPIAGYQLTDREAAQYSFSGMTLRDWFAGQALPSMVDAADGPTTCADVAAQAYRMADAMLAERANEVQP